MNISSAMKEKQKWLNLLLKERICSEINIRLINDNIKKWEITIPLHDKKIYLDFNEKFYLNGYFEDFPCFNYNLRNKFFNTKYESLPAPGAKKRNFNIYSSKENFYLNYDIFGLTFWMLNRCEEKTLKKKFFDRHNRFIGKLSHAFLNNYYQQPIVDQWLIFFGELIKYIYPSINILKTNFNIYPTHDIDSPRRYSLLFKHRIIKNYLQDLKNDFSSANIKKLAMHSLNISKENDPNDTFDWIMKTNKEFNKIGEFYFIAESKNWRFDTGYKINSYFIKNLMKKLYDSGNIISLHANYDSFKKGGDILNQKNILKDLCRQISVFQPHWGTRSHYLRFDNPFSSRQCDNAGLKYDSSLYFSDLPGFRCGTCKEYFLFDIEENKILDLREKPLIYMDINPFSGNFVEWNTKNEFYNCANILKNKCKEVGGDFIFLWHNCHLYDSSKKEMYLRILSD